MYRSSQTALDRSRFQVPYQAITCYHRQLTANKSFTEVFSGIPASIGMVAVALRDPASSTFVTNFIATAIQGRERPTNSREHRRATFTTTLTLEGAQSRIDNSSQTSTAPSRKNHQTCLYSKTLQQQSTNDEWLPHQP